MKLLVLLLVVHSVNVFAKEKTDLASPYDVVAPVLYGPPSADAREIGMIYYDNEAKEYKGINSEGDVDTLSQSPNVIISSTSSERIERAVIANNGTASILSQSGWLTSVTRNSAGNTSLAFVTDVFSSAPTCVVTNLNDGFVGIAGTVSTTGILQIRNYDNSSNPLDTNYSIICMGPR